MHTNNWRKCYAQIIFSGFVLFVLMLPKFVLSGVWQEDFNDGKADGWDIIVEKNLWEVKDGTFEGFDEVKGYSRVVAGDELWSDYTTECDVTLVGQGAINAAGILIRCDAAGMNAYRFWVRSDTGVFEAYKWMEGIWAPPTLLEKNIGVKPDKTYRLKVKADEFTFTCYVDGTEMGQFKDDSKFCRNGKIGLILVNARAQFDNIVVEGGDIVGQAVFSVGKLALTWGNLKVK